MNIIPSLCLNTKLLLLELFFAIFHRDFRRWMVMMMLMALISDTQNTIPNNEKPPLFIGIVIGIFAPKSNKTSNLPFPSPNKIECKIQIHIRTSAKIYYYKRFTTIMFLLRFFAKIYFCAFNATDFWSMALVIEATQWQRQRCDDEDDDDDRAHFTSIALERALKIRDNELNTIFFFLYDTVLYIHELMVLLSLLSGHFIHVIPWDPLLKPACAFLFFSTTIYLST